MSGAPIDGRLLSAACYVRQGAVFADVGTDHGYLPIFLLKEGRIARAILTDVNSGPLSTARANLASEGLSTRAELLLTDGALALEDKGVTDLSVCGMGGELIARIVGECGFLRREGVRLILQPMTKYAALRRLLYSIGFPPTHEHYSSSDGKRYVTLIADYTGECREIDFVTAELGEIGLARGACEEIKAFLRDREASFSRALLGKESAGLPADQERELLLAIRSRIAQI